MGQSYIKFGDYLTRVIARGEGRGETTQSWLYEDFNIRFRNEDGLDDWRFDGRFGSEAQLDMENDRLPEQHPIMDRKVGVPYQLVSFLEQDSVRIEACIAVPSEVLYKTASPTVDSGLFALTYSEGLAKRDTSLRSSLEEFGNDPEFGKFYLVRHHLKVAPNDYIFRGEVADRVGSRIMVFEEKREVKGAESGLQMSDIFLAKVVEELNPEPMSRSDYRISPNPIRTFERGERVSIYFELYGLVRDAFGQTNYEMSYLVSRIDEKEVPDALFQTVDLSDLPESIELIKRQNIGFEVFVRERKHSDASAVFVATTDDLGETRVTAQYTGNRRHQTSYLEIDVEKLQADVYRLTIGARDLEESSSGNLVAKTEIFRLRK